MRSRMKTHHEPSLMSICHPLNSRLRSPAGLQEYYCPCFTSSSRIRSPGGGVCRATKAPVDPRRLNPAASDAHPADVVGFFTSLASPHPAALCSSAEWTHSPGGCRAESVCCSSFSTSPLLSPAQSCCSKRVIVLNQKKQNKSQSNAALQNRRTVSAHPLGLDCYHNNVRLQHFHGSDSKSSCKRTGYLFIWPSK